MRPAPFITGEYYHVYNRGVDKRHIFLRHGHYARFVDTMCNIMDTGSATIRLSRDQSLALKLKVDILCYCLMPNHYHILIKQIQDGGITEFMHKLDTSFTKYFNLNHKRKGRLFEYTFKAKHIVSDELLLHVSRYMHINPILAGLTDNLAHYPWSSYPTYLGAVINRFINIKHILDAFPQEAQIKRYEAFVLDQIAYAQILKEAEISEGEDTLFL